MSQVPGHHENLEIILRSCLQNLFFFNCLPDRECFRSVHQKKLRKLLLFMDITKNDRVIYVLFLQKVLYLKFNDTIVNQT